MKWDIILGIPLITTVWKQVVESKGLRELRTLNFVNQTRIPL